MIILWIHTPNPSQEGNVGSDRVQVKHYFDYGQHRSQVGMLRSDEQHTPNPSQEGNVGI